MRKIVLLAAVACLFGSCEKPTVSALTLNEEKVDGSWKLVEQSSTALSLEGEFSIMNLSPGGAYELFDTDGQTVGMGAYSIVDIPPQKFIEFIPIIETWTTFEEEEKKLTIDRNILILEDPCCDQYQYRFRKR